MGEERKWGKKVRSFCLVDSEKYERKRKRKKKMGEEKSWKESKVLSC